MDTLELNNFVRQAIKANQTTCDAIIGTMGNIYANAEQMMKSSLDSLPASSEAKQNMLQAGENYKTIMKQMISMNKNNYEHTVKALSATQEKAEEVLKVTLDKLMMPQEAKNAYWQMLNAYKSGCEQVQEMFEANYNKIEGIVLS